ncbi:hypothetical protein [Halorubellus litoreus]|uniref:Uncharacterized protein n=1 Tax=Halorubellus litoreus TaxID=755308 RepID=A0ABD5VAS0_9EURY
MGETVSQARARTDRELATWQAGVVAGVLGGVVMAVLYSVFQPSFLTASVPGIYGLDGASGLVGWTLHVSHAAVLGVAFVAGFEGLADEEWATVTTTVASVAFAILVWGSVVLLLDPLWGGAADGGTGSSLLDVSLVGAAAHLAYGVVVGPVVVALR